MFGEHEKSLSSPDLQACRVQFPQWRKIKFKSEPWHDTLSTYPKKYVIVRLTKDSNYNKADNTSSERVRRHIYYYYYLVILILL